MFDLVIETDYLRSLIEKNEEYLREVYGLKEVKIVDSLLKAKYVLNLGRGNVLVPISFRFEGSRNINEDLDGVALLIHVRVAVIDPLEPMASKKAAKEIIKYIPMEGVRQNGGTIIIPLSKYVEGFSILLTDERLHVRARL